MDSHHIELDAVSGQGRHVGAQGIQRLLAGYGHDDVGQAGRDDFNGHFGPYLGRFSSHDAVQPLEIERRLYNGRTSHLHHHLFAGLDLETSRQRMVHAQFAISDDAQASHQPESANRRMAAQVHLARRREIAHRELSGAVALHEGRLAITQLGGHLLHQLVTGKTRVQQHHSRGVAAKRLAGECVNNVVFHSTITVLVV